MTKSCSSYLTLERKLQRPIDLLEFPAEIRIAVCRFVVVKSPRVDHVPYLHCHCRNSCQHIHIDPQVTAKRSFVEPLLALVN